MDSLQSFLHPKRKPNLKFRLGGFESELEMRMLSAQEDLELMKTVKDGRLEGIDIVMLYLAESLTVPDLHSKEILDGLAEREGRKIINAVDALKLVFNGAEIAKLIEIYNQYTDVVVKFSDEVEKVKN